MTQLLYMQKDQQGIPVYAPVPAEIKKGVTLGSGRETRFNIPNNANHYVVFFSYSAGAVIWVAYDTEALPPSVNEVTDIQGELNPSQRTLSANTEISLFNNGSNASDINMVMYAKPI